MNTNIINKINDPCANKTRSANNPFDLHGYKVFEKLKLGALYILSLLHVVMYHWFTNDMLQIISIEISLN